MWSNGSQYYGYWSNINDVKSFLGLQSNGSVLVSLNIFFFKKEKSHEPRKGEIGFQINTDRTSFN